MIGVAFSVHSEPRVGCVGLAYRAGADSTTAFGSTFGKYIVEISSNACRMLTKTNDCPKELEIASGDCPNRILQARKRRQKSRYGGAAEPLNDVQCRSRHRQFAGKARLPRFSDQSAIAACPFHVAAES
jgi:hypothetical protein